MGRFTFLVVFALFLGGCGNSPSLTGPGSVNLSNPSPIYTGDPDTDDVLKKWSPYAVVHMPGGAAEAYRKTMPALISAGNLRGVRFDVSSDPSPDGDIKSLLSLPLDGLPIISDYDLLNPDIEPLIDDIVRRFPEVRVFQIGNEISTLPKVGMRMGMEQYMKMFDRVYKHVDKNYPHLKLVTQSTFGSGDFGAKELELMAELGLNKYPPEKVIIGLNCYGVESAVSYARVINRDFGGYEVWITETGIDSNRQIDYVKNVYPVFQSYFNNLTRIYWYDYYDGADDLVESNFGYGLIKNIYHPSGLAESPLHKILASGGR